MRDEYYRYPSKDLSWGKIWCYILYRPSTQEIFEMVDRDQKVTGHEIANGLETWTRPAVN